MGTRNLLPYFFAALLMMAPWIHGGEVKLSEALASANASDRQAGLRSLLDLPPDAPMDVPATAIRSCLYDEHVAVRLAAISVLIHRKITEHNKDLMVLLVRGVTSVRAACAHALGRLGSKETCTVELWRSLEDPDESVRREAVASIDLLHGTKMGFMWDQDPREYRRKAQEALRDHLQIPADQAPSHAKKGS